MRYGHFDDKNREYVIDTPKTPLPWINYLGNKDFFSLISNTAGGYSFYKDAKLLRLTRYRYNGCPLDQGGRYYYIKDNTDIWCPGWQPVQAELEDYSCRHGLGYTVISGLKNSLRVELTAFVPLNESCELNRIRLHNEADTPKEIELFSMIEFCLWNAEDDATNLQRNLSIGEVEVEGSAIYHKSEYRERRNHYAVFWVNTDIDGFDTDREAFLGLYNGFSKPDAVLNGKSKNSIAHGWQPIGSHHIHISLRPGESRTLIFGLAYCELPTDKKWHAQDVINKAPAYEIMEANRTDAIFDEKLSALKSYWDLLLSRFHLSSNDTRLNRTVNIWNQYQCMATFNLSRSASYFESGMGRGMGFRDSCQDLLGFVHLVPERARERLIDIASTQHPDGSCYHQYQPLSKKGNSAIGSGFNDDPLWLIAAAYAYISESGDFSVLDEICSFDGDTEKSPTLLEHLRASFNYTLRNTGPHGLPLIGRADWNDCLNLNCFSETPGESFQTAGSSEGPVAESVFIAAMFVKYAREYADILRHIGFNQESDYALKAADNMKLLLEDCGWDGEWFLRAYDAFSMPVGSRENDEGKIYIEPQGMCVMAGVGTENGMAEKALSSVERQLECEYGIMLQQPAYTRYRKELGEISSYPPGYKENAGVFCHNNPWIICAEAMLGHGERAFSLFRKICPVYLEDISDIHRTEPYVYCQMLAGRDAHRPGEGKNSWLTGTAAWAFTAISQYILGIRPTLDGLMLAPCLPAHLKSYSIRRLFRGCLLHIHVDNPNGREGGNGVLYINGKALSGSIVPSELLNGKREVEIRLIIE